MPIGAFTDKGHQPTAEEMAASLGSSRALWERLARFVADTFRPQQEFKFYGKSYGWALRFRKGGKALVSLYPGKDEFTAQIILSETHTAQASSLDLSTNVTTNLEKAHPYPEGRWLFIAVRSERDLGDIQQLLSLKAGKPSL